MNMTVQAIHEPAGVNEHSASLSIPLDDGTDLQVPLTHATSDLLLEDLGNRLAVGRGFACATVNLDHAVKLRSDEGFRKAYARHSHVVADGNPIVWMSHLAGCPVGLVPGSDLVEPMVALAARRGWPIGFFGASEASVEAAAAKLKARHPGLMVTDRIAPSQGFDPNGDEADACIDKMAKSPARLWLLALGAPKQEVFAARAWRRLPDRGFLSVGAGIDFISGRQVRAPKLFRALALEWVWRMAGSPMRLVPRYARCAATLPRLAGAALRQRHARAMKERRARAYV